MIPPYALSFSNTPFKALKHIKKRLCPYRQRRFKRGSTLFGMYEAGKAFPVFPSPTLIPVTEDIPPMPTIG